MGQDEATSSAWPISLVKEEIAETIINGFVEVILKSLRMMSLGANDKVGTKIDELTKEFGLTFDGFIAGWHFGVAIGIAIALAELNVDNDKIATVFSVFNILAFSIVKPLAPG